MRTWHESHRFSSKKPHENAVPLPIGGHALEETTLSLQQYFFEVHGFLRSLGIYYPAVVLIDRLWLRLTK